MRIIAPLGLLAALCLIASTAHAEVNWLQRQCDPTIDALRAIPGNEGIGNDAAKAIAREELPKLPGLVRNVKLQCGQWIQCSEGCNRMKGKDCRRLRGKEKRQCNKEKRRCRRGKCDKFLDHAQCRSKRGALWRSIKRMSPPAPTSPFFVNWRQKVQKIYDKCRVIYSNRGV